MARTPRRKIGKQNSYSDTIPNIPVRRTPDNQVGCGVNLRKPRKRTRRVDR